MFVPKYLTEEEILTRYRDAKDKKQQIQILADMNLCEYSEMLEFLKARVDPKALPRTSRLHNTDPESMKERAARSKFAQKYKENREAKAAPCISSEVSPDQLKATLEFIAELQKQRLVYVKELEKIDAVINRVRQAATLPEDLYEVRIYNEDPTISQASGNT